MGKRGGLKGEKKGQRAKGKGERGTGMGKGERRMEIGDGRMVLEGKRVGKRDWEKRANGASMTSAKSERGKERWQKAKSKCERPSSPRPAKIILGMTMMCTCQKI